MNIPKRVRNHVNPLADQQTTVFGGFDNDQPIIVDIGAYRGEFTHALSAKFGTQYNYIVCEIRKPYLQYLENLFAGQSNTAVFGSDAARNITNLLGQSRVRGVEIAYIFINFPDPWFKEKHKKRRVLNTNFLDELKKLVSPETKIIFQTDQKDLFQQSLETVSAKNTWRVRSFDAPLWGITSHWEDIKVSEGCPIYRAQIQLVNK